MTAPKSPRPSQGAGELSGLLKRAEALHRELDQAQASLKDHLVEGEDASGRVRLAVRGDGTPEAVELMLPGMVERDRENLQEAIQAALKVTLERLFELRKAKLDEVTRGLQPPGLFS